MQGKTGVRDGVKQMSNDFACSEMDRLGFYALVGAGKVT